VSSDLRDAVNLVFELIAELSSKSHSAFLLGQDQQTPYETLLVTAVLLLKLCGRTGSPFSVVNTYRLRRGRSSSRLVHYSTIIRWACR
jgi:hypothetical protein